MVVMTENNPSTNTNLNGSNGPTETTNEPSKLTSTSTSSLYKRSPPPSHILENGRFVHLPSATKTEKSLFFPTSHRLRQSNLGIPRRRTKGTAGGHVQIQLHLC
mmetsp:Transcript_53138/g.62060  ORF Transcript_53138/g.62060 Transcript_53138/m.62060 type:complete len:104 (+) Transcript_53138:62-373(+)